MPHDKSAQIPNSFQQNNCLRNSKLPQHIAVSQTLQHSQDEDMMTLLNTMLPVSHQHLLTYTSSKGALYMHDIRCKKSAFVDRESFEASKGIVTCMAQGKNAY